MITNRIRKYITDSVKQAGDVSTLLAIILVIAAVIRVWHVVSIQPLPLFDNLIIDSKMYDEWAMQIAKGNWLGRAEGDVVD